MTKNTAIILKEKFDALKHFSNNKEIKEDIKVEILNFVNGYVNAILEYSKK